jgi:Na+/H+-dicarboxylate symporter
MLLAMVIGAGIGWAMGVCAVGHVTPGVDAVGVVKSSIVYGVLRVIADLFVNALKLIVAPVVVTSVVLMAARLRSGSELGRLGAKTLIYYLCTSTIAVLIGLVLVDVVKPGAGPDGRGIFAARDLSGFAGAHAEVARLAGERPATAVPDFFHRLIPENFFSAALTEQLLGILVVSLVTGFFLGRLGTDAAELVLQFTQGAYEVTMKICGILLALAPIGVLALLAVTVAEEYPLFVAEGRLAEVARGMMLFCAVVAAGLAVHVFVALFLILRLAARVRPLRHFAAMFPALGAAFSTASTSTALPLAMECVETRAGVSQKTASFVLPLGTTINMDGGALYACVAAVFLCQAFGMPLSIEQQFMVLVTGVAASIGMANVPAGSLIATVIVLQMLQAVWPAGALPGGAGLAAGLGLLLVVDRPLAMLRAAVNAYSDACGAAVVGRTEGELLARIS